MSTVWTDERGVTVQIGAVLLLGVLVLLLTGYQASVVPTQNQNVEFTHNERVQSDLLELRNGIVRAATSGTTQPESVDLGTTFPSRAVAVNPAPASGRLGPSSVNGNATITGAEPLDPNARRYWLNDSHDMSYRTEGFKYEPSYREYGNAPATLYENTVLYNAFPDGQNRTLSGQSIVDGRTISLVSLQGVPTRSSSGTIGFDVRAISPSSTQVRTITVTNETSSDPVNITLPTRLSQQNWTTLLEDELAADGYVDSVVVTDGNVTINMKQVVDGSPVTYNLRTAAVTAARTAERPEPAYITVVDGANRSVPENTTNTLVAEVRDRYNNPVSGANVDVDPPSSIDIPEMLRTNAGGLAAFTYTPTSTVESEIVSLELHSNIKTDVSVSTFSVNNTVNDSFQYNGDRWQSSRSGRVNIQYTAEGTGSSKVTLNLFNPDSGENVFASRTNLSVYSFGSNSGDGGGSGDLGDGESIRQDPETGENVTIVHSEINFETDYSDEILIIPSGTDFVPVTSTDGNDQDNDVVYEFYSYDIDGNVQTNEEISLTATDGPINFGSDGSAISGRHLNFTARGPNGSINVDGANIETTAGNTGPGTKSITFDTTGDISAVGTTIDSDGGIEFIADGSIDLTNADILVNGNNDVVIDAGDGGVQ